ncbi:putative choline transport protein [Botrytis fragariae]|uniref:Putative choline transport protein n=1 Tax=Botrytis fragariae TaxID=1964551 RepID=A0A8H6ALF1_9HELO|nr:putative choline transport protein [Botrytis fragariae]KAF5869574.1 putative choline transport protein [Botrytis fragariae]
MADPKTVFPSTTLVDELWESINTDPVAIALPSSYVKEHQLEPSTQYPWNPDKKDQDVIELARAGKKQVLRRRFALVSLIGFACSLMGTWEGVLVFFLLGYQKLVSNAACSLSKSAIACGGPAGLIYGFLVIWFGTFCTFVTMSELASMVPTAGGSITTWQSLHRHLLRNF